MWSLAGTALVFVGARLRLFASLSVLLGACVVSSVNITHRHLPTPRSVSWPMCFFFYVAPGTNTCEYSQWSGNVFWPSYTVRYPKRHTGASNAHAARWVGPLNNSVLTWTPESVFLALRVFHWHSHALARLVAVAAHLCGPFGKVFLWNLAFLCVDASRCQSVLFSMGSHRGAERSRFHCFQSQFAL